MASLKDIRRRIGSVKNTQQITKAMKMVAAAKLRRAQQAILGARPFAQKLDEITARIVGEILAPLSTVSVEKRQEFLQSLHPLLKMPVETVEEGTKKKVALIVVSSDRGLCGAYNSNAIKAAVKRRKEILQEENVELSLFFVGRRGRDYFTKRGMPGTYFEEVWQGRFTTEKSSKVARYFTEKFLAGEFDRVEVSYTEFRSAISQVPQARNLLPLNIKVSDENAATEGATLAATGTGDRVAPQFIYKPDLKSLLAELLPKQVETQFYKCLADSLASEFGSRMTAMDNATRNASDMISRLSLEANRVRQASITKELMEIIGGAEALKG